MNPTKNPVIIHTLSVGIKKHRHMNQQDTSLIKFQAYSRELTNLKSIESLLSWDQETTMPSGGASTRAGQRETLASLYHERLISSRYRDLVELVANRIDDPWVQADVQETRRLQNKAIKIPPSLIRELAKTTSLAFNAWVEARLSSDFSIFYPWLTQIVHLKRQEAKCLQVGKTLYDALLDEYEPGSTESKLNRVFSRLRPKLTDLLEKLQSSRKQPSDNFLKGNYSIEKQKQFGKKILTAMGFDWNCGRLDHSPHPFCSGLSPRDVRITTRYEKENFGVAIFGMIHEGGHALYEQGLDNNRFGLPANTSISLGIHESQSRLWENVIGRSTHFWKYWYPLLQKTFPKHLDSVSFVHFLRWINRVKAGLIRVEADEVSYGLHVILRFELERELLSEKIEANELEIRWNHLMEDFLGVHPSDASTGILQDVHWASGLFGYFPTYLIGSIYATQLYSQAQRELSGLDKSIENGDLLQIREWLRERIHRQGKVYQADELLQKVTGETLSETQFIDYLKGKYQMLFDDVRLDHA